MERRRLRRTPPSAPRGTDSATRRDCCTTSRRFRESVDQLQVWFGQGRSPAAAQFVENRGSRSKSTDSADFQDADRASCSARRSSSVRSSPSSSATRSTTVPSGSVVGSPTVYRPGVEATLSRFHAGSHHPIDKVPHHHVGSNRRRGPNERELASSKSRAWKDDIHKKSRRHSSAIGV